MFESKKHKKSTSQFIMAFIDLVIDTSQKFVGPFARKSWHYKDLRIDGFGHHKIYRSVSNLRQRGILKGDGSGNFRFTKKGTQWAEKSARRYFPLRGKIWDKKWRVVIFDIPQELHTTRVKFGQRLKTLGFFMLQKSVFIIPYPCEEELGDICADLKITDYVDILIAENAGYKADELKKHYNLQTFRTKGL